MDSRVSLAVTAYERRALDVVAEHRGLRLYHAETSGDHRYSFASDAAPVLLRKMSLRQVVKEYERLIAEGAIAA